MTPEEKAEIKREFQLDLDECLTTSCGSLAEGLEKVTRFFQSNVEGITDPVKFQDFLVEYARKENELFQLLVQDFDKLKGKTPGASMIWRPSW